MMGFSWVEIYQEKKDPLKKFKGKPDGYVPT